MADKMEENEFKVYKRRFAVLFTVTILNISNAALWISYSPVATTVANYYNITTEKVNWFSLVYLIVTMPFTFISTYTIDKVGLKFGIYLGASLNCAGSILRAFGTSGVFPDLNVQYAISLTGQIISAMAQSFLLFIPTKVSQLWFPESQRAVATTVLAMSNPLGIVIAEGATPFIVNEDEDKIPLNNYIWMGLAIASMVCTIICVTRSKPKTPPSLSAEKGEEERPKYVTQLKTVFTSAPFMIILLTMGCGIGIFNMIATLTQQLLCPLGYSDVFSGTANVVMILMGFVGAAISGVIVDKTKLFTEVTKIAFGFAALFLIFMFEFYMVPNQKAAILIFCGLFGFFGFGVYPIALELAVEVTYPVEETISTAFIFLSGQIQGIIAIALIPVIATSQDSSRAYLNECDSEMDSDPKDYSLPLMITMTYMSILVTGMIIFLKAKYKRMEADESKNIKEERADSRASTQKTPTETYEVRL